MTATVNKSNLLPSPSPLEIMGVATLFRERGRGEEEVLHFVQQRQRRTLDKSAT